MPNYTKKADTLGVLLRPERRSKRLRFSQSGTRLLHANLTALLWVLFMKFIHH